MCNDGDDEEDDSSSEPQRLFITIKTVSFHSSLSTICFFPHRCNQSGERETEGGRKGVKEESRKTERKNEEK